MDWAKGLVRNIINVQNNQIAAMQSWLDANPTLAGTSEACYTKTPFAHPDCADDHAGHDHHDHDTATTAAPDDGATPDSLAVMGALALGLLGMDI